MPKVYRRFEDVPSCVVFQPIPISGQRTFAYSACYRKHVLESGPFSGTVLTGSLDLMRLEDGNWVHIGGVGPEFLSIHYTGKVHFRVVAELPMNRVRANLLSASLADWLLDILLTKRRLSISDIFSAQQWGPIAEKMSVPPGEVVCLVRYLRALYHKQD